MKNKTYHPSFGWITPEEFAAFAQKPLVPPVEQGTKIRAIEEKISSEKSAAKKKRGERGPGKYVSQRWFLREGE